MIEIDGSLHSGSGTLLRYAVALATLTHQALRMFRIRAKRPKPGLRAQHVKVIEACATISGGRVEGGEVGSGEILYSPGPEIRAGKYRFDIGTAGSAAMAAFALIPPSLFACGTCQYSIVGGLFQDFAPTFFHMDRVLLPLLQSMGADVKLKMVRPGYYPEGKGELVMTVKPASKALKPIDLIRQGSVTSISGIALASHLKDQQVAKRMVDTALELVGQHGFIPRIDILEDTTAVQKGAALMLSASTDAGCIFGADQAGKLGRRAEAIAHFVVKTLFADLDSGATVDRHVADQLVLFAALAQGASRYRLPMMTDHVESNLWLVEKILGTRSRLEGSMLHIEGVGRCPESSHA